MLRSPSFEEWRTKESPDTVADSAQSAVNASAVPDDSVAKLSNLSEICKKKGNVDLFFSVIRLGLVTVSLKRFHQACD